MLAKGYHIVSVSQRGMCLECPDRAEVEESFSAGDLLSAGKTCCLRGQCANHVSPNTEAEIAVLCDLEP